MKKLTKKQKGGDSTNVKSAKVDSSFKAVMDKIKVARAKGEAIKKTGKANPTPTMKKGGSTKKK